MGLVLKANTMASAIADSLTAQPPRILAANFLRATEATTTASADTTGGEKENAYAEGFTFDFWRPGSSGTHWLKAAFTAGVIADETLDLSGVTAFPSGLAMSHDGLKLFVADNTNQRVLSYSLSVPFDVSSAKLDSQSLDTTVFVSNLHDLTISSDGVYLITTDAAASDFDSWKMSVPYDLSTAVHHSVLDGTSEDATMVGGAISPNGLKFYALGITNDNIYSYTLTTAFDLSTATHDAGDDLDVSGEEVTGQGIAISKDGRRLFLVGSAGNKIYFYTMMTAFDLGSATYDGTGFDLDISSEETAVKAVTVSQDESGAQKVYSAGAFGRRVNTYTIGVPANALGIAAHDLHNHGGTVKTQNGRELSLSTAGEFTAPVDMALSADGLHVYVLGANSQSIKKYTLGTAFDLSTAVYDVGDDLDTSGEDTLMRGLTVSSNGLHLFACGTTASASVYAYTMSTAHDLSTATYDGAPDDLDVSGQDTAPNALAISEDGLHLFVVGQTNDKVYAYTFGVAYDGSSLTYDGAPDDLDVSGQDATPQGLTISFDGLHLYMVGSTNQKAYAYTFGVAYDGSTLTYDGAPDDLDFSGLSAGTVRGCAIDVDGKNLFIQFQTANKIYGYTLNTPHDLGTAEQITWIDSSETFTPRTSEPILILFDDKIALNHRLLITVTSAPNIGSVYLGCAIPFDGATQRNFTPPSLATRDKHLPVTSEGGHFLGRSIVNQGTSMALTMSGVGLPWLHAQWEAHVRLMEQYPFFFALRDVPKLDGVAEGEAFYGWATAQPSAGYKSGVYGTIGLSARGIVT